jgi:DNA-binding SARP family transcriptional activator/Flp pilus assembly protein TadD
MTQLAKRVLHLLGPTRVEQSQKAKTKRKEESAVTIPRFRSRRTVALLGYLAVEQRPVARDFLAALFWPDEEPSKGRGNLRRELYNLAKVLPDCWALDNQAVAFVPSVDTTVDLYEVVSLQTEERWDEAVDLLGGEFLEGLYLDDNAEFENWLLTEREVWRGRTETILTHVIEGNMHRGRYSEALVYTQRFLQLTPWNEEAYRQAMQLLAWTGKRGAALRLFDQCKQVLLDELDVEPDEKTLDLYQRIQSGELDVPPQLPAFFTVGEAKHPIERPLFVAREAEMTALDGFLQGALVGEGRVVFVTGGPGRGKTALVEAFARHAMERHPDLLVASGNCNAYSGVGDPYLPFRDVLAMLSGDVEARWDAGTITRDHAQRLWEALPLVVRALLEHGPDLLDVLVPGEALLSRAMITEHAGAPSLTRLREQVSDRRKSSKDVEQRYLFQQVTGVLRSVAQEKPLILILDDIQWADATSIGLLFHLGRNLTSAASRILIICAYRPEEVAFDHEGGRHPLAKTLSEFKRTFGDVWIDLGTDDVSADREFVEALLNAEPNQLSESFRAALFQRTQGHPLFTVELLLAMQERGDLIQDEHRYWIEGLALDWEVLPARVEAVIKERIDRLDPDLQNMLTVASVEGEVFTAQVVADVQELTERSSLGLLSGELEKRHRLVKSQEETQTHRGTLSRYRFGHVLFQEYIYNQLGPGERRLLHRDVAIALEKFYDGQLDEMAVQLGHHYRKAGDFKRAFPYIVTAAERAARIHATDDAIRHYTQAIELSDKVSLDRVSLANLHRGRGLVYDTLGDFEIARADLETGLKFAHTMGELQVEWRLLLDLGKAWASRDYHRTREYFERALELARNMNDAASLGRSLNWMGNWYANAEDPKMAAEFHKEALEIFDDLGDQQGLARTLDLLGIVNLLGGDHSASVGYYDRAVALFQELDNRPALLSSLMGRGTNGSLMVLLATASANTPTDAQRDIEEAIRMARNIHSPSEEAWADWSLGLLHVVHGQFGRALEFIQNGLRIASEIEHREWLVGNRFALGILYDELFAPEEARQQLETALTLAKGLRSQYWIHHVVGALAEAYYLLGDPERAQDCLKTVISPDTPMDTMGKRYCWARYAELLLVQGEPVLALDTVERLIASAPGLRSGDVITFLWWLKGEVLATLGHAEKAVPLLQTAVENAQELEERFLQWHVHASLGKLHQAMNHQSEAQIEISAARGLVDDLAATVPVETLKESYLEGAYDMIDFR